MDRERQRSCAQMDAFARRAVGNIEIIVPDATITNRHDHVHRSRQHHEHHPQGQQARTVAKAALVRLHQQSASTETVHGNFAKHFRTDTVPEVSTAVQCTDLVINASEPTFPTEPRPQCLPPKENPAGEARAGASQRERQSDTHRNTAHRVVVRPL